jgi:ketosteroid isomerase-like protein
MKSQFRVAALLTVAALSSFAQSGGPNDLKGQLERLHDQWLAAFNKGDGATMDSMEVPNLILINADGKNTIWKKPGPRAGKQKPQNPPQVITFTDGTVRQFGDTAILTGTLTSKQAGTTARQSSTTVVWVRQAGKWLIASVQWSDITPPQK